MVSHHHIFKWVQPGEGETYFRFWVAPVTMVLESAHFGRRRRNARRRSKAKPRCTLRSASNEAGTPATSSAVNISD